MVAATSLPRWILGHYDIGAGARMAWWGRARLRDGHAHLPDGRAQPLRGARGPPECKTISKKKSEKK
jgi:hypothetical protein